MTIRKLTAMPYAQAHIEIDNANNKELFSYVTRVASLTNDGWLTIYGLHSQTTRKHISAFCNPKLQCPPRTARSYGDVPRSVPRAWG